MRETVNLSLFLFNEQTWHWFLLFNRWWSDPPENCHLTVKNCQKLDIFWQFFLKKCQVFGNFLTFKWQFSADTPASLLPQMWCGPKNCLVQPNTSFPVFPCLPSQTCVVQTHVTCLTPPCLPYGECRDVETVKDTAAPGGQWGCVPNQASLGENCAKIILMFDKSKMPLVSRVSDRESLLCLCLLSLFKYYIHFQHYLIGTPESID